MFVIQLKDNDFNGSPLKIFRSDEEVDFASLSAEEKSAVRKALDSINNVSLKDFESRGAIVFPSKSVESDLGGDSKIIFTVQNLESDAPVIKTTNVMGFFAICGVHFEITSRFDNDVRHFFLHYMLQKVCDVSPTVELTRANKNPFYEFLVYLFPAFLKKAVAQGLFRSYISREYNDSNIRGVIDFPRHFRFNIPFNGKVAYRMREYNHDNFLTRLVRHTVEFIAENKNLRAILSCDEETRDSVQKIRSCTESYSRFLREQVISKNLKTLSHPYYTEY